MHCPAIVLPMVLEDHHLKPVGTTMNGQQCYIEQLDPSAAATMHAPVHNGHLLNNNHNPWVYDESPALSDDASDYHHSHPHTLNRRANRLINLVP